MKDEHTRASRAREQIDRDMSAVAARLNPSWQGGLAGTGESLKTLASYRRKVADAREKDIEIGDAIKQHDLHRYTFAAAWLSAQDYLKPGQECEIPAEQPDWPERRVASNPPENWTEQDLAGARAGVQRIEATQPREAATDLPRIEHGAGLAGSGSPRGPPRLPEFMRRQAPEHRSREVIRWRRDGREFGDKDRGRGDAGR